MNMMAGIVNWIPQLPLANEPDSSFWFPPEASNMAGAVDWLYWFILILSTFFFAAIVVIMAIFVVKYQRKNGKAQHTPHHSTALELTWSIIPGLLLIPMFYWGFTGYMDMRTPPREAYEIQVIAQKWNWTFQYPNGHSDDKLHVPVDRDVKLIMQSNDVIHSFFVPAFRQKQDIVPGRYSYTWFRPTRPGIYELFCTEYCGDGHSEMISKCEVHKPGEFEVWLKKAEEAEQALPPAELGKLLYKRKGCIACHTDDGTAKIGPTFKGLFAKGKESLLDGTSVTIDENYLRESILDPNAKVVTGFSAGQMPTFKGQLNDKQVNGLVEYIKTLK